MQTSIFKSDPFDKRSPFKIQERARRRRLLRAISTGVIPALSPIVILLGIGWLQSRSWPIAASFGLTSLILVLSWIARGMAARDRANEGGYLLLISFLIITGLNGVLIEGFEPAVAPSYAIIVVMAGMMLGVAGGFTIAVLAAIMWLLVEWGIGSGIVPEAYPANDLLQLIAAAITVVGFLFIGYMGYLATQDLQQALDDTTYELVRVNRQLEEANKDAQRAKERVEAILNNSPDVIVLLRGGDGGISGANPPFHTLFGLEADAAIGRSLLTLVQPEHGKKLRSALHSAISEQKTVSLEVTAVGRDGNPFDAGIALAPIKGGEYVKGIVCTIRDISQRVRTEEQIRSALAEKESALAEREVLLKEIHHRVKNNLQVISSLLRLQANALQDEEVRSFFVDSENRVQSMALIHEQLYQAEDLARIDFRVYMENLANHLTTSYGRAENRVSVVVDIEQIFLAIDTAIPCGLIINEMVSNSFKHAFPDGRAGTIEVSLKEVPDGRLCLRVRDDGIGLPDGLDVTSTQTLGMQLVNQLIRQLAGSIHVDKTDGTSFELTFNPTSPWDYPSRQKRSPEKA